MSRLASSEDILSSSSSSSFSSTFSTSIQLPKSHFHRPTKRNYTTMKYFPDSMAAPHRDYISQTLNSHAYYMPVKDKTPSQTLRPSSGQILLAKKDDVLIQRLENSIAARARTNSRAATHTVEETIMVPESISLPESSALGEKKARSWRKVVQRMIKGHGTAVLDCKRKDGSNSPPASRAVLGTTLAFPITKKNEHEMIG